MSENVCLFLKIPAEEISTASWLDCVLTRLQAVESATYQVHKMSSPQAGKVTGQLQIHQLADCQLEDWTSHGRDNSRLPPAVVVLVVIRWICGHKIACWRDITLGLGLQEPRGREKWSWSWNRSLGLDLGLKEKVLVLTNKSSAVAEMGDRGHNRWAEKRRLTVPLLWRAATLSNTMWPGSPSSTMWTEPRPTSMSSAILIHPAVWPQ